MNQIDETDHETDRYESDASALFGHVLDQRAESSRLRAEARDSVREAKAAEARQAHIKVLRRRIAKRTRANLVKAPARLMARDPGMPDWHEMPKPERRALARQWFRRAAGCRWDPEGLIFLRDDRRTAYLLSVSGYETWEAWAQGELGADVAVRVEGLGQDVRALLEALDAEE